MNREAVALGTPVCTTFEGRLGAVDERLIAEGRLRKLEAPADVVGRSSARERAAAAFGATRRLHGLIYCSGRLGRHLRMRRRLRSAAVPVHRHALPQIAWTPALVALAYFLSYQLRFDEGVPGRYQQLLDPLADDRGARQRDRVLGVRALPPLVALRLPARFLRVVQAVFVATL